MTGMVDVATVSFFAFLALVIVIAGFVFWKVARIEHEKEMKLIEEGEYPKKEDTKWVLAIGLILVAIGVGRVVEAILNNTTDFDGITVALLGVAALIYHFLSRRSKIEPDADDTKT
ncbi:MAG: hypothetical protein SXQ77_11180 [Halobacteria archaeon]|nr:hypothetical protein [Halobacteria archaeon]